MTDNVLIEECAAVHHSFQCNLSKIKITLTHSFTFVIIWILFWLSPRPALRPANLRWSCELPPRYIEESTPNPSWPFGKRMRRVCAAWSGAVCSGARRIAGKVGGPSAASPWRSRQRRGRGTGERVAPGCQSPGMQARSGWSPSSWLAVCHPTRSRGSHRPQASCGGHEAPAQLGGGLQPRCPHTPGWRGPRGAMPVEARRHCWCHYACVPAWSDSRRRRWTWVVGRRWPVGPRCGVPHPGHAGKAPQPPSWCGCRGTWGRQSMGCPHHRWRWGRHGGWGRSPRCCWCRWVRRRSPGCMLPEASVCLLGKIASNNNNHDTLCCISKQL